MEIWKPIKEYEGIYEISNLGRIKSLSRTVIRGKYNCKRVIKEKIISTKSGDVSLCKDGKKQTKDLQTIIKIHFDGFKPKGYRKEVIFNNEIISRRNFVQKVKSKNTLKTSKYIGVSWHIRCKKWIAKICINKKDIHLGYFYDEKEAYDIYLKACKYEYLYQDSPKLFRDILKQTI